MKRIITIFTLIFTFTLIGSAQFPKLPKFEKPKMPTLDTNNPTATSNASTTNSNSAESRKKTPRPATTILKPSLTIRAARDLGYWKQPDLPNYWSWMPQVAFAVSGPIADASYFTYEFTTPDGKLWYSIDTAPFAVAEGSVREFESEAVPRWSDKRSTILTGTFGFKIILKNPLQGTSKELYKGTFKVNKKFAGTAHKDFKNQNAFYVENDWLLPIGYADFDYRQAPEAPMLQLGMWFRGDFDSERLAAYIFRDGKQISSTKNNSQGAGGSRKSLITEGDDQREFYWSFWNFSFFNIRAFDTNKSFPDSNILKNNPGNYEVKVLLDGELVRTASFTVGGNGEIIDNGIAANNNFGGTGVVIPVKIIAGKEGTLNLQAWKTDAFYANPLSGFSVQ